MALYSTVYVYRKNFVRSDHIMKLRGLLQSIFPKMTGLTDEEKDPEELLTALFSNVFDVKPYLTMRLMFYTVSAI